MKKSKINPFFKLLIISFIIYVAFYVADITGYYEKTVHDEMIMTKEAQLQFEEDIASNKAIDVTNYLPKEKDYSNFFTKGANKLERSLGNFFEDDLSSVGDILRSLFIG